MAMKLPGYFLHVMSPMAVKIVGEVSLEGNLNWMAEPKANQPPFY
jgi:hypothetical protein